MGKMQKVLILFASREGQTAKIARQIREHLAQEGIAVDLVNAKDTRATAQIALEQYNLLIFGVSMHAGGLARELVRFINRNAEEIKQQHRTLFLVLLSAATKDPQLRARTLADAQQKVQRQLNVSFDQIEMIAGALTYSKYSMPVKWLMRRIAKEAGGDTDTSKDYEYTDWSQVARYAARLIKDYRS
jgi:menaquinone-dependent protoporphyrinogen oxidase